MILLAGPKTWGQWRAQTGSVRPKTALAKIDVMTCAILGTNDRHPPLSNSVGEHVLDNGDDFGPQRGITCILHLDFDSHIESLSDAVRGSSRGLVALNSGIEEPGTA
jgi:hypothetical protein